MVTVNIYKYGAEVQSLHLWHKNPPPCSSPLVWTFLLLTLSVDIRSSGRDPHSSCLFKLLPNSSFLKHKTPWIVGESTEEEENLSLRFLAWEHCQLDEIVDSAQISQFELERGGNVQTFLARRWTGAFGGSEEFLNVISFSSLSFC